LFLRSLRCSSYNLRLRLTLPCSPSSETTFIFTCVLSCASGSSVCIPSGFSPRRRIFPRAYCLPSTLRCSSSVRLALLKSSHTSIPVFWKPFVRSFFLYIYWVVGRTCDSTLSRNPFSCHLRQKWSLPRLFFVQVFLTGVQVLTPTALLPSFSPPLLSGPHLNLDFCAGVRELIRLVRTFSSCALRTSPLRVFFLLREDFFFSGRTSRGAPFSSSELVTEFLIIFFSFRGPSPPIRACPKGNHCFRLAVALLLFPRFCGFLLSRSGQ